MKTTPDIVKIAAIPLVAHGALLALGAVQMARQSGDWSGAPGSLLWLGFLIVMAGALLDLRAWAWWIVTIAGGLAGIFNLLQVMGYALYRSGGVGEVNATFSPALTGLAGVAMLIAVGLLMLPESKAAFGLTPPTNPPRDGRIS